MPRSAKVDPLMKFKFRVSIPGLFDGDIGFQKCSPIKRKMDVITYNEGGYDHEHKLGSREKVEAITLEKGMFSDRSMEEAFQSVQDNPEFRTTVIIEHCDRWGNPVRTFTLAEAWISSYETSDFDASSDDVAIEKITIEFEHLA